METTLNAIRKKSPCEKGWVKLLKHLGKKEADDEPLAILTILDSNGLDDALWCLRAVKGHEKKIRLYAVWCARQVQHLMKDQRSLAVLDVAEAYANGRATDEELKAARVAARVAWAAAGAASEAARVAWAAAWAAAGAAEAARAASEAAGAAGSAAWEAARAAQKEELCRICSEIGKDIP
jgi:hypothetical protein